VIACDRLTRRFGSNLALVDLDLRVERGEIVGLLGHNGAGKTTTVRLLGGVLAASSGRVRVLGYDPIVDGVALRRRIGVLTETPAVDERLTGRQGLRFFADVYNVPPARARARVDELLGSFGLGDAADARVATYSKGMRQRLALARTLLHEPELLLLDEPITGLDPLAAKAADERIRALRATGTTVVLCTHNLTQAEALCDRVLVLEHGRTVASGAPAALVRDLGAPLRVRVRTVAPPGLGVSDLLAQLPGVSDLHSEPPAPEGVGQHRFTARDEQTIARAASALVAAGVDLHALEPERPSLEDVYFALHQREGRQPVGGVA
jgi:ABC-2 type transport system ATP-binding protein